MTKVKKPTKPNSEEDEPYHHPHLEEQIIVRFPADIAQDLIAKMEPEANFTDFEIVFNDKNHATVKIGQEVLSGILVNLPTIVESHRTVDGSHLFKSADIGEILIIYRSTSAPTNITADNTFENGITPPTIDILERRNAQRQSVRSSDSTNPIEGIEYWEMVEIQLAALLAKDKTAKPITRHEFFMEPDIDAGVLERALRLHVSPEYKGYSGQNIADDDLDKKGMDEDPIVHFPDEILEKFGENKEENSEESADNLSSAAPDSESTESESSSSEESESESSYESENEKASPKETTPAPQPEPQKSSQNESEAPESSSSSESSSSEEDDEDEKKGDSSENITELINALRKENATRQESLKTATNVNYQKKLRDIIEKNNAKIAELEAKLAAKH
ncbi:hypothetical protein TVAG_040830 [Trichomonas vaginalis G3]|uniref:TAFII55 protein conserved region domain-containing protein n=1 Tax=Trichomonas vaginalis (strain ATCC PRA-98 / G3) TaxID=412133 RepID=A2EWP5_TRIV3|nr:histone acetyltransferase binding [Trichomonas vaginalis G3]EAY02933.1 hypothetical protein TVAG_040830 [Trichomonas vaginalis G3]KAI5521783.1 histone acetyltransferase binding [Trichomonas vaginalis G3]|eukprot:XP_001315156.1 hypothetical protein [Trichomonas vaginalis G3]